MTQSEVEDLELTTESHRKLEGVPLELVLGAGREGPMVPGRS